MRHFYPLKYIAFAILLLWLGSLTSAWAQCAAPTGLAVSNITGNSATLSFTPAAGAVSYTVSYTSTSGGMVTTISPAPTASPVDLSGLTPLTNYTVTVVTNCAGGATSPAVTRSFLTINSNDEPCQAIALPLSGATCQNATASTTAGATTTVPNGYTNGTGCGPATQAPKDVWFTFTTAATGPASTGATITVTGNSAARLRLFSAASCAGPFTDLACSSAPSPVTTSAPALSVAQLTPSTTYYVRVDDAGTLNLNSFTICVKDPSVCGDPYGLSIVTPTSAPTTAVVSFQPGFGNTSYTLITTAAGSPPVTLTPSPTTSPITLTGLLPATTYTLTLRGNCPTGGPSAVLTQTFTTPNAHDEPVTAQPLPLGGATCTPVTLSQQGATRTAAVGYSSNGCALAQARDVWASFTTAASGPASQGVTLTVANVGTPFSSPAREVRLFSSTGGVAGPFTELACTSSATSTAAAPPLVAGNLTPATTYYVRIASDNTGSFTICATNPPACPGPQNVTTTTGGNNSQIVNWSTAGGGGGTYTVEYGPTNFVPGTGTIISGLTGGSATLPSLTVGTTYDVYVRQDCGGGVFSTWVGPVTFTLANPVPANDEPCGAIALTITPAACTPTTATTLGATFTTPNGYQNTGLCRASLNFLPRDVWFSFTTPATGPTSTELALAVTGDAAGLIRVFQATSCNGPFAHLACAAGTGSNTPSAPLELRGLQPSTTYYVQVAAAIANDTTGTFTICATALPPCPTPPDVRMGLVLSNSAQLLFGTPSANTAYTITYAPKAGGTATTISPAPTSSPVTLAPLQPNTTYRVVVTAQCTGGQGLPTIVDFTTPGAAPANDLCSGATPLICGQRIIGTNYNATRVGDPQNGCSFGSINGPGVFYRFVGTGDSIVVSTCNPGTTAISHDVLIFSGSCANLACVSGLQAGPGCGATVSARAVTLGFKSQIGTTYFIFVNGAGNNVTDQFELSLDCVAPTCTGPTLAGITQVTNTTATVIFAPVAGGSPNGYTVTATPPPGGTVVTTTGSTSPIVVSGLATGTNYTIAVQANCGNNTLSPPSVTTVRTTGTAACTTPTLVTVSNVMGTTASVNFTPSAALSYVVRASPLSGGPVVTATGTTSPIQLTTLLPSTSYTIALQAVCGSGAVGVVVGGPIIATASACSPPTAITVSGVTASTASVVFTATPGATGYTATATPASGPTVSMSGPASPLALTGLLPGTAYTVTARANCPGGTVSAATAAVSITTLLAARDADLAATVGLLPNPAHHAATLTVPAALLRQPAEVSLRNALGQLVGRATLPAAATDAQLALNLSGLPAGLYLVQLTTSQGPLVKRLLVE